MSQALHTSHVHPVWTAGDYLLKARKDAGLEQSDVAKALGVSRALVGKWEHDQSVPAFPHVIKFAKLTNAAWLVESLQALSDKRGRFKETADLPMLVLQ